MKRIITGAVAAFTLMLSIQAQAQVSISNLPSATTPLAGTEVLPIVQGGVTKKVPASALSGTGVAGVSSFNSRTGAVAPTSGDYSVGQVTGAAPIASPTFTGTVTVPNGAALGTPTTLNATNATNLNGSNVTAGTVPAANGGTGINSLGAGVPTALGSGADASGGFCLVGGSGCPNAPPAGFGQTSPISFTSAGNPNILTGAQIGAYSECTGSNAVTITLPQAGTSGQAIGVVNSFKNKATALCTIAVTTSSLLGVPLVSSAMQLLPNQEGYCVVETTASSGTYICGLYPNGSGADSLTAHAGGGQVGALPLLATVNRVSTVATAADSVILPASYAGNHIAVRNDGANALQAFGLGSDTINGVASGTGVAQAAGTTAIYLSPVAGKWVQLVPASGASPCSAFGTTAGTCAQGNDSRITGALQASNNLSDVATPATALTNIGGIGAATTNTLTNKAYDTAGTGNTFKVNGTTINAVSGTGSTVCLLTGSGCGGGGGGGMFNYSDNGLTLTANTYFAPIGGGGAVNTTEAAVSVKSPSATTVTNLQLQLSADPGAGQTLVATLRKGGVDTTLTCTVTGGSGAICQDLTHSVTIAQNDLIDWKVVTTGTYIGTPTLNIAANNGTSNVGVTSVAATVPGGFSITGSPITTNGTLAISANGTSGGVPYYSGATTMASSAALAANALVVGGGAGAAPSTITTGTGVGTALGITINTSGGVCTVGGGGCSGASYQLGGGAGTAVAGGTTARAIHPLGLSGSLCAIGANLPPCLALSTARNITITNLVVNFTTTVTTGAPTISIATATSTTATDSVVSCQISVGQTQCTDLFGSTGHTVTINAGSLWTIQIKQAANGASTGNWGVQFDMVLN